MMLVRDRIMKWDGCGLFVIIFWIILMFWYDLEINILWYGVFVLDNEYYV